MLIKSLLQVLNQVLNVAIQVGYTPIIYIYTLWLFNIAIEAMVHL